MEEECNFERRRGLNQQQEEEEFWLPKEVWEQVAGQLGEAREVLNFGSVCKTWREISKDPRVWRSLIEARWPRIASIDGLLDMRRGGAGSVGIADELVELYRELHRQTLFVPQPVEGGSNRRLNFFRGKGPKKLKHTWTYSTTEEGCKRCKAVICFEGSVFVLLAETEDEMGTPLVTRWLQILDAQTGSVRARFTIDQAVLANVHSSFERNWSLGISEKHRLLVVSTPNLVQACQLDALLMPSSLDQSEDCSSKLTGVVWTVRPSRGLVSSMAVVDVHSRVYLLLSPKRDSVALCAVSLSPRNRTVTDLQSTPMISAAGTQVEWSFHMASTWLASTWFSVATEDDVLAFSISVEESYDSDDSEDSEIETQETTMIIGPLSKCTEVDSTPEFVHQGWFTDPETAVIVNDCLVSNSFCSLSVHSLEGKLLFDTGNSLRFQRRTIRSLSFPVSSFFHPEENIKLALIGFDRGPPKLVKFRADVEPTGDRLVDWDWNSSFSRPFLKFFDHGRTSSRSIATSDMAYFINSEFALTGVSLTTPDLKFSVNMFTFQPVLEDALPPGMIAIPATPDSDSCEAGLLLWTDGDIHRFNGPTTWPSSPSTIEESQ